MKLRWLILLAMGLLLTSCAERPSRHDIIVKFDAPAAVWEECIPLGNGHIGMMPDGGVEHETIILNDITLWSGAPYDASNPKALSSLPQIRQLLLEGRNYEAQQLMYETFVCGGEGSGHGQGANTPFGCYQTLGKLDLVINCYSSITRNYSRTLNLSTASSEVNYSIDNHHFHRNYFISRKDDVAVIRLTSDTAFNIQYTLTRPENATVNPCENGVVMEGQLPSNVEGVDGMRFYAKAVQTPSDDPTTITLLFAAATSYLCDNPEQYVNEKLDNALALGYDQLYQRHLNAYRELYDRVELDINGALENASDELTLEDHWQQFLEYDDAWLPVCYFQYGRYLLISSTQEELLPPNLQGLWANTIQTP